MTPPTIGWALIGVAVAGWLFLVVPIGTLIALTRRDRDLDGEWWA